MKKYFKILIIILAILFISISLFIFIYVNKYPLKMANGNTKNLTKKEILSYNKFYEGIFVNNIDLKDLTKEEAINKIKESLNCKNKFNLKYKEYSKNFSPEDIDFSYNIDKVIDEAFNVGRVGNDSEKIKILKNLIKNPKNFEIKVYYNSEKLNNIIKEISEKLNCDPVDEKFTIDNDKLKILEGKSGIKTDIDKIISNFKNIPIKFEFDIPILTVDYKKIDKNLINSIKGIIGESSTNFDYQPNRNNNIKIAANKMNEIIVNPGEIFSFSDTLGEVSNRTGYKAAGAFVNDKIVDSIGGGICQVSSTLYQALVKSDLHIVERKQHSMRVSYCTIGLDAMYYNGSSDLKFKNNFDFPIIIKSYVTNNKITFKILGDTDKKNYKITLFTSGVSTIPMPIEEIKDPDIPEGEKVIVEKGFPGYKGSSYVKKGNNAPILLNSDYYKPKKQIIKIGTKKKTDETTVEEDKLNN